jgi:hypothetical protein
MYAGQFDIGKFPDKVRERIVVCEALICKSAIVCPTQ